MKRVLFVAAAAVLFVNGAFAQDDMAMRRQIASNCMSDIQKFCADVKPGNGAVRDCLVSHKADLSDTCKDALKDAKDQMNQQH